MTIEQDKPESITKPKGMLVLGVTSIIVSTVLYAMRKGFPVSGMETAEILGAALGLVFIPAIVMAFGKFPAAMGALFIVAALSMYGDRAARRDETTGPEQVVRLKGCDFTVSFPAAPTLKDYSHPQLEDYQEAQWISKRDDGAMLRAECVPIPNMAEAMQGRDRKDFLIKALADYAEGNGMSGTSFEFVEGSPFPTAKARGNKKVSGKSVTYMMQIMLGPTSLLTQITGGLAVTFPQEVIHPFLDSPQLASTAP